ncbi:MAG: Wzy polymerase domain-containing protein, partial [Rhodanobacter sp.]
QLLILGMVFLGTTLLWPLICDALLLSVGRSMADQMNAGVRLPYWWSMLDAIGREPLLGYGWQQVGAAQQRVALDYGVVGSLFDHSHNFLIDLLLWNGIPIGGFIIVMLGWWFIAHMLTCRNAGVVWLLAAAGGVFVHGMLEYPLEYAYFLIPVGLSMGAVDAISHADRTSLRVPRWTVLLFTALLSAVFVWAAAEYLKVEEAFRTQRMEMARIGVPGIVTPAPKLRLLTQMEAFLQVAHVEPTPNMPAEQIEWLRKMASRVGYASVISRYALALALNGSPEESKRQILIIRQMFGTKAYEGVKARFNELANSTYPELWRVKLP